MPNITISGLPPVTLPLDDPNTVFEVAVIEGGVEVSRRINLAQIATAASFPLLAPNGSAVAPSYSFVNDAGAGMFLNALGELSFAADGVEIARAINGVNNQFAIAQSGSSSVPDLTSLADLDTGFRFPANNQTVWIGGGSAAWNFSTAKFFSQFSNGPALLNEISSDTNPTVVPDHADPNTGMGHPSSSDELSLIAGGVEGIRIKETAGNVFITYFGPILVPFGSAGAAAVGFDGDDDTGFFRPVADAFAITAGGVESVRYAELSSHVIQTNENQVGLTASVTQTQAGGLPLLSSYNEIATVGTTGDALTAFGVVAGTRLIVINNGVNNLQLFPAVGDDIGAGVDTAITIVAGSIGVFIGRDATNWDTLSNAASSSVNISDLVGGVDNDLLFNVAGVWTGTGASGLSYDGFNLTGDGVDIICINGSSLQVDGTGNIIIEGTGQFLGAQGSVALPGYSWDVDEDSGMYAPANDILGFVAGGVEGLRFQEASSRIIQRNANHVGLTASVTQTQAGGLALISSYNEVSTVANSGDALTAFGVAEGDRLIVINNGANDLQLFPAVGDDFGAGVNTAITIPAGEAGVFLGRDSTNWDTLAQGVPDPLLLSDGSAAAPSYSFSGATDMGMFRVGASLAVTTAGILRWAINTTELTANLSGAPLFRGAVVASATVPTIMPNNTDINTGLGWFGADALSMVGGGVELARFTEAASANQFAVVQSGAAAIPDIASLTDLDTGLSWNANNILQVKTAGATSWQFSSSKFVSSATNGPGLQNLVAGLANVVITPDHSNVNTGLSIQGSVMGLVASANLIATVTGTGAGQFIISPTPSGTGPLPSFAFGDGDTGFYEAFDDSLRVSIGGADRFLFFADQFSAVTGSGPALLNLASAIDVPTILPDRSDTDTGLTYASDTMGLRAFSRTIAIIDGPNNFLVLGGARLVASNANGPAVVNFNPTSAIPVVLPRRSDSDTGLGCPAATTDKIILSCGGIEGVRYTELNGGAMQVVNAELGITAFATGGQGSAVQLDSGFSVIGTVGTTGDSVKLPPVFDLHSRMHIKNDGANAADVFPASGDDLGAGTDTAVSLAAGVSITFLATVVDATWTSF